MPKLNGIEIPQHLWDSLGTERQKQWTNNPEYSIPYFNEDNELIGVGSEKGIHWGWGTVRSNAGVVSGTGNRPYVNIPNVSTLESSSSQDTASAQPDPIKLSSSLINTPTPTPTPTPPTPKPSPTIMPPKPPAKTAPIETILFDDQSISPEIMADLVFEDIGGHELLSISRNDIVNGQPVSYTPIKNLGLVQQRYNPNNILGLQSTSDKYFANFAIKFDEKVPLQGNGINGLNVYIEEATGDLIIETINMNSDEQIEVQVAINGTIYEANFGEITS
jgi:hypothetical protein